MPITPGGRFSPGDSDDWDLTTDLAAMQVSNETATANAIAAIPAPTQNYQRGTNAQRLALSGANLFEGLQFYTTDTKTNWVYNGSAWLMSDPSGFIVRPTSVVGTGVTIGVDHMVNFTGSSSITVNGAFTTRFRRYRVEIVVDSATAAADMFMGLRNGGAAVGATAHSWVANQTELGGGPSRSQSSTPGPTGRLGRIALGGSYVITDLSNPAHNAPKLIKYTSVDADVYSREGSIVVNLTSLTDGFTITTTNSSAATGRIRIYGML